MIKTDSHNHLASITLSNPARLNALTVEDIERLGSEIHRLSHAEGIRCIVVRGDGDAFSSGADLIEPLDGPLAHAQMMTAVSACIRHIVDSPKIVVAVVDGVAVGVGASIALACDVIVATTRSRFILPFARMGLVPDGGVLATLAASLGRATAVRLALRGDPLTAGEAYTAGLVSTLCDPTALHQVTEDWTTDLIHTPALAQSLIKDLATKATLGTSLETSLALEHRYQRLLLQSDDFRHRLQTHRNRTTPATNPPPAEHKDTQ